MLADSTIAGHCAAMDSIDIIGFDLDGTLVDTSGDLTAAVNHALALAGRAPLDIAAVKPMIGLGAKHMLERGLAATGGIEPDAFKPLYRALLQYYGDNIAVHSRPYPGALALLDALDARGIAYGVVTNKFEGLARNLLDQLDLSPRLSCIIGGDTMGPGRSKPAPDPVLEMMRRAGRERALFVGDSIYDIDAGRSAGAITVAVSFGFLHQPIDTLGADHVIDHFDELLPLIERL
jgi:phosphoglycolate phosphatase